MSLRIKLLSVVLAFASGFVGVARAGSGDQPALYKAYYLEKEAKDYAAAQKLYERLADDSSAETQRAARAGAARCRDHVAASNFATLMPADTLAYVELSRPGQILEKLFSMLGLAGKDMNEILAKRPNSDTKAMFHVPQEVCISPSIFEVLNSFGGAAVAITHFDPGSECPSGVMVVHHGDVSLLKGLLETGFQFAPTAEKIRELPTFGADIEGHRICGVLTESLLVVGSSRDLVDGVIGRLVGKESKSLASRDDLSEVMAQRAGATLFAYVDMQAALKIAEKQMDEGDRREFATVNAIADLHSLRWATFSFGIHEGTLSTQLAVRLADDHHSIAYNLMRLPPMTRKCLSNVPQDAAGVFGLGLNPELAGMALKAAKGERQAVTGFDIGREFFGNIQEICAFVIPGKMSKPESEGGPDVVPNVGILLAVNDVARSRALWDQILTIPGLVAGKEPIKPKQMKIGETDVMAYQIPEFGKIYMTELDGCIAIGVTRNALKAAIHANEAKASILKDEVLGKAIANMPKDSSIMLAAHMGRCAGVAAGSGDQMAAMVGNQAAQYCRNMVVSFGVGQAPNQFSIRGAITGLPDLNEVLKQYGPMIGGLANMAAPAPQKKKPAVASRRPPRGEEASAGETNELPIGGSR